MKESRYSRGLPLLLVPAALLTDIAAARPVNSYFFRDFTIAFYPLRLFAARELREGRLATWNPFVFEGSFQLPALYPPELLHALWPTPAFVSWILTLHLPLAALAAYWLTRELGGSRPAGFVSGAVYSLAGFALSCLNLYVFLQALALAPFVVGLLRRAALRGGRSMVGAAVVVALALSTMAVEFVAQSVVLGVALGLAASPSRASLARLAAAVGLGAGLAGLPIALTLAILPETARGAGYSPEVVLANAVHPAVFLQALVPGLFGLPAAPAEAWWGGRFFTKGLPYFLSLYIGPVALALAAVGAAALPRRVQPVLLVFAGLGAWYAFGERGGLAPLLSRLPLGASFRFPSKALLLPHLALATAAGFAIERLRFGRAWGWLAALTGFAAAVAVGLAVLLTTAPTGLVAWTGVLPSYWPNVAALAQHEAGLAVLLAVAVGATAWAAACHRIRPGPAVALVATLMVADLAWAGRGLNSQVHPSFFAPEPDIAALKLDSLDGGRVFSYGLDHSPAFRAWLGRGGSALTLKGLYLDRQILGPYTNVIDGVEAAESSDLTGLAPRERELDPSAYDPGRVRDLVPWLRNAGVARVLSLDPLSHPDLVPLATVPVAGAAIHVYGLDTWPRASLACRATPAANQEAALSVPYREGFDPWREVALVREGEVGPDRALPATCTRGRARLTSWTPTEERYDVEATANAHLVVRASYARGWHALVDGVPQPVLRANGKHRAVAVDAGRHLVVLRYEPPGLVPGAAVSLIALAAVGVLFVACGRGRR